jgi:TolB protein
MRLPNWIVPLCVAGLSASSSAGFGQIEIPINRYVYTPGTAPPIPVYLSGFSGEAEEVLKFDLYVQGFCFTNAEAAQFQVIGGNNGNVWGRVLDPAKQIRSNKSYGGASVRREAHLLADDVVKAAGGIGIGTSRIAFKVKNGERTEIWVADFDGNNAQPVTADNALVAAPCWVPHRAALCYTSYKLGNPDIFYHDLQTGERRAIAHYSGMNSSVAVSPDGNRVAMILSKGGSPNVYVSDIDGANLKRLTSTHTDDSSPCWSPDGEWVCYATKVSERRVLCKIPANGGQAQRIATSEVSSPSEPDWSPDGQWIAFTRQAGGFDICVVPAGGGRATVLVSGEDPCWSANSRTLIFVRDLGAGRHALSLLDVPTKQVKDVFRVSGSSSQPSWAR